MRRYHPSEIVIVDLQGLLEPKEIRGGVVKRLGMPDSCAVSWEALSSSRRMLAGKRINLILYNSFDFYNDSQDESNAMFSAIRKLSEITNGSVVIQYDDAERLPSKENVESLQFLFNNNPSQFGLRGDEHLWRELREHFRNQAMPKDEVELQDQIYEAIELIAGHSVEKGADFFVKKYDSGGMSSGYVNAEFWNERGIPLLIGRYRMAFTDSDNVE